MEKMSLLEKPSCSELIKISKPSLAQDLCKLLTSGEETDITLRVRSSGGDCWVELQAHRLILSARSSVFAAMFRHNLLEKRTEVVQIEDVDSDTMKYLLEFIYTDGLPPRYVPDYIKATQSLLAAADKYNLERLRTMCEEMLRKRLTTANVAEIYEFAYLHNCEQLRVRSWQFIMKRIDDVTKTDGWCKLLTENPGVFKEVIPALINEVSDLSRQNQLLKRGSAPSIRAIANARSAPPTRVRGITLGSSSDSDSEE